jgi:heptosyltransferase III
MSLAMPSLAPEPSILFVTATRIGDAVLSTGLLGHLVDYYPGARFTIASGPVAAPLFADVPGLEKLIPLTKRRYAMHWLDLYRQVAGRRWDMVVDLRGSALAWLLRKGERRVTAKGDPTLHRVVQLARCFELVPPPVPRLWTKERHEAEAARLISGGPVLAIGPTANWAGKQWRAERFVELIGRLTATSSVFAGARVAIFAAPHERAAAQPVLDAVPADRLIDLTNEPDLLTVAAALRRTTLFIGNDTGLMHIAAAVGAPTLGLFGPSPAAQYSPWGRHTAVAQTELSYTELVTAPDFDHRRTGTLMDTLSVDRVEAAATALFARSRVSAA